MRPASSCATFRLAGPSDASAIARIYNEGIEDRVATFETVLRSPKDIERSIHDRGARFPTVVATIEGEVTAVAWASEYRARPCYSGIAEFSVYVGRRFRGRGLGTATMRHLISECESQGFWKLLSRIFPENAASLRLCTQLGFRQVGLYRRHGKLDGRWRDTVIVERLIGDGCEDTTRPLGDADMVDLDRFQD